MRPALPTLENEGELLAYNQEGKAGRFTYVER
jgi:hypothetical protein